METKIRELQSMFPSLPKETISSVLRDCKGKVHNAVDHLLEISSTITPSVSNPAISLYSGGGRTTVISTSSASPYQDAYTGNSLSYSTPGYYSKPPVYTHYAPHDIPESAGRYVGTSQPRPSGANSYNQEQQSQSPSKYPSTYSTSSDRPTEHLASSFDYLSLGNDSHYQQNVPTSKSFSSSVSQLKESKELTAVREKEKKMILMRGLPGSGKSTLARRLKGENGIICSTDDFFYVNGQYMFDSSKLSENHEKNRLKALKAVEEGISPVIIDNTNVTKRDMEPYVLMGYENGYVIEFRETTTHWRMNVDECFRRNSHNVPIYAIERMLYRFEKNVSVESIIGPISRKSLSDKPRGYSTGNEEVDGYPTNAINSNTGSQKGNFEREDWSAARVAEQPRDSIDTEEPILNNDQAEPNELYDPEGQLEWPYPDLPYEGLQSTSEFDKLINLALPQSETLEDFADTDPALLPPPLSLASFDGKRADLGDNIFLGDCDGTFVNYNANTEEYLAATDPSFAQSDKQTSDLDMVPNGEYTFDDLNPQDYSGVVSHSSYTLSDPTDTVNTNAVTNPEEPPTVTAITYTRSNGEGAIDFLRNCFPDKPESVLLHCWECSGGIIDTCMDLILTSDHEEVGSNDAACSESSKSTDFAQVENDNPSRLISEYPGSVPEYQEDEDFRFARQLQDELNSQEKGSKPPSSWPNVSEEGTTHSGPGPPDKDDEQFAKEYGVDEGFVLRLPRMLAYHLQEQYGSVEEYIEGGDVSDEDLVILLSERVAKSLYYNWVETLKTKMYELEHTRNLQRRSQSGEVCKDEEQKGPVITSPSKKNGRRRKKGRKIVQLEGPPHQPKTSPGYSLVPTGSNQPNLQRKSLNEIMDEELAHEIETKECSDMVSERMKSDRAFFHSVQDLYINNRDIPKQNIDRLIVQCGMNTSDARRNLILQRREQQTVSVFKESDNPKPVNSKKNQEAVSEHSSPRHYDKESDESSYYYQEFEDPNYKDFRAEANLQAELRNQAFQKAATAWKGKQSQLASFYAEQGREHGKKMKEANQRAAELIYKKNRSRLPERNKVDLHGLHVEEALQVVQEKLYEFRDQYFEVITGKGHHSYRGVSKVKSAVISFLKRNHIRFNMPQGNPGLIEVFPK